MRLAPAVSLLALTLLARVPAARADTTLDHVIRLDASRVSVREAGGVLEVSAIGGAHEVSPGRPDIGWFAERVDLPPDVRVTGVEVLDVQTTPLADGVRLASAVDAQPGVDAIRRSTPDDRWYGAAGWQPEALVAIGAQGSLRGRAVAMLRVAATRWDPRTGRLERVASVRVRLTLASAPSTAVRRERIVREWEDELPTGVPTRALGAALTSLSAPPAPAGLKPRATPFAATQVPSLLGSPVEYVIVTNDAMAPTFQQLADWKTQEGVPAVVRTVSFIHDQYPSAADDAERIRLFLRDAYARWGTKWVLLGGDTDVIPVRLARTEFYGGENIACDLYYSCLDGNWDANGNELYGQGFVDSTDIGDDADLMPEVYVGRAPVSTPAEAQTFVNKTLGYEKTPVGGYEHRWLWFAEVLFPQPWAPGDSIQTDGASVTEGLLPLTDQRPGIHVIRMYQNYTDPTYRPGSLPLLRQSVLDSMSAGLGLALHVGHGYRNVMQVPDGNLVNADAAALTNGSKLFNLYSIDCTSNAIDFPCIGEAFVKNPNGGAVTNVGSTRFDFPVVGDSFQYEYFRLFIEDSVTAVGELQARQKLPFLGFSHYDNAYRWTEMTLLLLGDPELRMWCENWRPLTASYPASISVADSQFTVTVTSNGQPVPNATVTAYRPGDDYSSAVTDGSGMVTLPFRPDSAGAATITVTAYNARPFQGSLPIVSTADPSVSMAALTLDDGAGSGTIGNSDGFANAGETVDLRIALRNRGGTVTSGAVNATISTTDSYVTITRAASNYGVIAAGSTANPFVPFRIVVPANIPDQREIPFSMVLTDGVRDWRQTFQITVRAPALRHVGHAETETVGNHNGRPQVGETVNFLMHLRNGGTGVARSVTAKLRCTNGLATMTDSTASFGDIAPGATVEGDAFTFSVSGSGAQFQLVVNDLYAQQLSQTIDLTYPLAPFGLAAEGFATSIKLTWQPNTDADLAGYNVYRSTSQAGPFALVNPVPTDLISYYQDENLTPLTKYFYYVTAVDSSGNESSFFSAIGTSTNPPTHAIFPVPMGQTTPSSVALEFVYSQQMMDIAAGSDLFYVFHADGSAPVDADGNGQTLGEFSLRGHYFAAGPSIAPLKPGEGWSFVAPSWDSAAVYVFDPQGNVRPGWPFYTVGQQAVWSSAAIGDLDGDGENELAFGSNGNQFYVLHADGSEWMDGDNDPSTKGVFKVLGQPDNFGTPALADLDGDGHPEIIYGSFDGSLYAWKSNGSNVPGFPFVANGPISDSPAVGFLDGPGDTTPEIVFATANDSLYVIEPNGTRRPGWPVWIRGSGTSKVPSPALADMNRDGFLDIVFQSTNGGIYVINRNGVLIPPWSNIRYSTLTSSASESSPVVADINGDGFPDVICGDENAQLAALSGATATMLPGFPIQLTGEVRGTPAVGDIDRDGMSEIVLADWDKNLYVWDYDFPYSPAGPAPWPQFHHDARRTGFASAPLFVGVNGGPDEASPVRAVELAAPSPNPSRPGVPSRLTFGIPASVAGASYELAIYDLSGRRVKTVGTGVANAGRYSLRWDLRDESGRPVSGGVYFARFTVAGHQASQKLVVLE